MRSDVLIVGGGIGGSVLALALARRGWRVTVLEREATPKHVPRPELLWGSTVVALDRLDVGARVIDQASLPLEGLELRRQDETLLSVSEQDLAAAGAAPRSTDPDRTRAIILDAALGTGAVELQRGARVDEVVRVGEGVVARGSRDGQPFETTGRLLIGDDGAHSVVRQSLRIEIELRSFGLDFVTSRLQRAPTLPGQAGRVWLRPSALPRGLFAIGFLPLPGGEMVTVSPMLPATWERLSRAPDRFWAALDTVTPLARWCQEHRRFPEDFTRVRRSYGHAKKYAVDGAALIGDALHPMSPAGGQGANAAIADALALAEVAHDGLAAGDLSERRLARYEQMRRAANDRSLWFTERAAALLRVAKGVPLGWLIPVFLRRASRDAEAKRALIRKAATAFVS